MLVSTAPLRVVWVSDGLGDAARVAWIARAALHGGVRTCVLREPALSDSDYSSLCATLYPEFEAAGGWLIAHERPALARVGLVHGLHLRASSLALASERAPRKAGLVLGVSTHSKAELAAARAHGATYAFLGSVFATSSHEGAHPLGVALATELASGAGLLVVAIGGIDQEAARSLCAGPWAGVACIRAISAAPDPERAARALVAAMAQEGKP